jgi:hypothetical protein
MIHEVKVFDSSGNLKKVISTKSLAQRSNARFNEMFKSSGSHLRNYKGGAKTGGVKKKVASSGTKTHKTKN